MKNDQLGIENDYPNLGPLKPRWLNRQSNDPKTRLWRPFCNIFLIAVSISLCGLTVGIFLGSHISSELIESRDTEIKLVSADLDGLLRTSSIHSQSSGVAGLPAFPSDIPKPVETRNPIDHTEGTLHSKLRLNKVICTYVKFNGTFDGVPGNVKSLRRKISSLMIQQYWWNRRVKIYV